MQLANISDSMTEERKVRYKLYFDDSLFSLHLSYMCDWACKNQVYLHKKATNYICLENGTFIITVYDKTHSVNFIHFVIDLSMQFENSVTYLDSLKSYGRLKLKIKPNFVCRYVLFLHAQSHIYSHNDFAYSHNIIAVLLHSHLYVHKYYMK